MPSDIQKVTKPVAKVAPQPRRILYIEANEDGTVGGSHQVLFDLVTRLDRTRYEPIVLFYQENSFAPRMREKGIEVHVFTDVRRKETAARTSGNALAKWSDMLAAIPRRRRYLIEQRIDAVHINNAPIVGNDDWLPAARLVGIPIVVSAMGDAVWKQGAVHNWLSRRFDRVLAVSQHMYDAMAAMGVPRDRLALTLNGIDLEGIAARVRRGRDDVRRELKVGDDQLLLTMVGNVRDWKGQHVLLEALGKLGEQERSRFRAVFVGKLDKGSKDYWDRLHCREEELGLGRYVSWLGMRDDVPDLFAASDLAVHCSVIPEPFGLVVIEALALGTPVAATNAGGPAEVLTPACGWLYDPRDPNALADILRSVRSNPGILADRARGARVRAADFSVERMVRSIVDVYESVFRAPRGSRY